MGSLRIKWVKSTIGYPQDQRSTIRSLGLRRLQQEVEHPDVPTVRGMIAKVSHLVRVEEIEDEKAPAGRSSRRQNR